MIAILWMGAGGFLGTIARYLVSSAIAGMVGETFPWGTVIVNISGCFIIGILATTTGPDGRLIVAPDFRQFLLIGICGGYTTFSSFSLQTLNLLRAGDLMGALGNVAVSVIACMVAVWLGAAAGQAFNQLRG
jgi:fluoride exporter